MKNIKASYFIKSLFSYIDEKHKLKIAKYNKGLQKNINITIANYKYFTGKYIIYESNGVGKEYNSTDNLLIYEGEYLHGERNGKGKEYGSFNGRLIFEGEYLYNNRRKGKSYFSSGKLEFEGEYLNEKKYNGKVYDRYKNIIYEIKKGNGKVKEYDYDTLLFEGEYLNGQRKKGRE